MSALLISGTAMANDKLPFQAGQGFDTKYLWDKNLNGKKKWLLPKKMLKDQFLAKLLAYDKTQYLVYVARLYCNRRF